MSLNLIKYQRPNIDKNYFYVKDQFKSKYQLLTNGGKNVGIKKLIDYSQTKNDVYENLEYNYPRKKEKHFMIW